MLRVPGASTGQNVLARIPSWLPGVLSFRELRYVGFMVLEADATYPHDQKHHSSAEFSDYLNGIMVRYIWDVTMDSSDYSMLQGICYPPNCYP